ncbi:unnamed protein product [Cyprideis torosa]|uniref:Fringe-like glycosyltransferase domain-containing protein n=1 Tax=Cyprideis torosa TaxID=163714 RepID=A0A7R8W203_9CRUS|nr:unnamed protein product [Cyprideis torosa]CAG0881445.1 unnamed protein product [Cyprideis torosa]
MSSPMWWLCSENMRFKLKRTIQAISCSLLLVYIGILFKNTPVALRPSPDASQPWKERAPRSIDDEGSSNALFLPKDLVEASVSSEDSPEFFTAKGWDSRGNFTTLDDIFISVKTTKRYHDTRLELILKTWFNLAPHQTFFFTDGEDPLYARKTGFHLLNSNCSSSHHRRALCCKMAVEFDTFLESNKKWFCHFDDDNYVNVPRLLALLKGYDARHDWYLGKLSIRTPLEILNRDLPQQKISFWFATGGAGFCLSRAMAYRMMPLASGGKFIRIGEKIRLPDDVTIGYIIEHLLGLRLTVVEEFHSHLEPMKFMKEETFPRQVGTNSENEMV